MISDQVWRMLAFVVHNFDPSKILFLNNNGSFKIEKAQ